MGQSVHFVTVAQDAGRCTRFSHKVIHRNCGKTGDAFPQQTFISVYMNHPKVFRLTP